MGSIAPAGQMSAQAVHSGRQKPSVKVISGCMNVDRLRLGFNTPDGQALIHSWHAVQ